MLNNPENPISYVFIYLSSVVKTMMFDVEVGGVCQSLFTLNHFHYFHFQDANESKMFQSSIVFSLMIHLWMG